ncbi:MAG: helix-turn-helix transcriptional regulator [Clostridia bacterium]|nr:helix-turn-helix transcriptional regulator [Clostridia bacterium]
MMEKDPILISAGRFTSRGKWIHPRRCLDSSELIVMIEGMAVLEEGGRTYRLSPGTALVLEEGLEHAGVEYSTERVSFYWLHMKEFSTAQVPGLQKQTVLKDAYALFLLFRLLLHYNNSEVPSAVSQHLLQVLLAELRLQGQQENEGQNTLVARICEWIRINSDQPLTVSEIALQFGYNEDYLSRLFKKHYGKGLKAVVDEMKLLQIKRLLMDSDLTLAEIANALAFEDYKLFLKFFKYHEGITPTEFRNHYGEIHTNNR